MRRKPELWAVLGSRGSGKSAWVRQQVERIAPRRLAVWDLMREHRAEVETADLGTAVRAMGARSFSVAFHPSGDGDLRARQFDLWCRAMLAAGDLFALVEELAFVTRASFAPAAWSEVTLLGRHRGLHVVGTSQRPASVDKAFMGNLDLIHTGRLTHEADARTVAPLVGVPHRDLMTLPDLHWVERRAGEISPSSGVLSFASGTKPKAPKLRGRGAAADTAGR